MQLRRSLALLCGAILLSTTAACGFDPNTGRINDVAPGDTARETTVDVLNAVIVSGEEGSGTFVTTLVNNDLESEGSLEAVTANAETARVGKFDPVSIAPNGMVNLVDEGGIPVEGDFRAGDVVPMTLQLSGGESVQIDVPVVPNCDEFAGIDGSVVGEEDCEVSEPVGEH